MKKSKNGRFTGTLVSNLAFCEHRVDLQLGAARLDPPDLCSKWGGVQSGCTQCYIVCPCYRAVEPQAEQQQDGLVGGAHRGV